MTSTQQQAPVKPISLLSMCLSAVKEGGVMKKSVYGTVETKLAAFLAQEGETEIRLYFGYSLDFGHLANTVAIMNRLISYFPKGKKRQIRLLYDIDPADTPNPPADYPEYFASQLATLIPALTIKNVLEDHQFALTADITLYFNSYNNATHVFDPSLNTACTLCVSGGFEQTADMTKYLRVKVLLVLTPYQFTKNSAKNVLYFSTADDTEDAVLLGPVYNKQGTELIAPQPPSKFGITYTKRASYLPDPAVDEAAWQYFKQTDAYKYSVIKALEPLWRAGTIEMQPVYFTYNGELCTGEEFLLNNCAGITEMKALRAKSKAANKCSVLLMLNDFDNVTYASFINDITRPVKDYPKLSAYIAGLGMRSNINLLPADATPTVITDAIARATANGIIIVRLGDIPQYILNYVFTAGALPCVFTGEANAPVILNAGVPFVHLPDVELSGMMDGQQKDELYPTLPLDADPGHVAQKCRKSAQAFASTFDQMEHRLDNANGIAAGSEAGTFMYDAYNAESDVAKYFASLKPFYHDLEQDKLLMAIGCALVEMEARDINQRPGLLKAV